MVKEGTHIEIRMSKEPLFDVPVIDNLFDERPPTIDGIDLENKLFFCDDCHEYIPIDSTGISHFFSFHSSFSEYMLWKYHFPYINRALNFSTICHMIVELYNDKTSSTYVELFSKIAEKFNRHELEQFDYDVFSAFSVLGLKLPSVKKYTSKNLPCRICSESHVENPPLLNKSCRHLSFEHKMTSNQYISERYHIPIELCTKNLYIETMDNIWEKIHESQYSRFIQDNTSNDYTEYYRKFLQYIYDTQEQTIDAVSKFFQCNMRHACSIFRVKTIRRKIVRKDNSIQVPERKKFTEHYSSYARIPVKCFYKGCIHNNYFLLSGLSHHIAYEHKLPINEYANEYYNFPLDGNNKFNPSLMQVFFMYILITEKYTDFMKDGIPQYKDFCIFLFKKFRNYEHINLHFQLDFTEIFMYFGINRSTVPLFTLSEEQKSILKEDEYHGPYLHCKFCGEKLKAISKTSVRHILNELRKKYGDDYSEFELNYYWYTYYELPITAVKPQNSINTYPFIDDERRNSLIKDINGNLIVNNKSLSIYQIYILLQFHKIFIEKNAINFYLDKYDFSMVTNVSPLHKKFIQNNKTLIIDRNDYTVGDKDLANYIKDSNYLSNELLMIMIWLYLNSGCNLSRLCEQIKPMINVDSKTLYSVFAYYRIQDLDKFYLPVHVKNK